MRYTSETATCRERLVKFCVGAGLDIGSGGDPILPTAICVEREACDQRRADCGDSPVHLIGDAAKLHWFNDNSLDYVFSSHCLEDFADTLTVLREWMRVLKPYGNLVLFLPDQQAYLKHCREQDLCPNGAHAHPDFSLDFVKQKLWSVITSQADIIHELFPVPCNPYSFDLVIRKPPMEL